MITMFPARPDADGTAGQLDQQLHEMAWGGYVQESISGPQPVTTSSELTGVRWRLVGAWLDGVRTHTSVVLLEDSSFFYWMRLDAAGEAAEAHSSRFDAVVASVAPVPRRRGAPPVSPAD